MVVYQNQLQIIDRLRLGEIHSTLPKARDLEIESNIVPAIRRLVASTLLS